MFPLFEKKSSLPRRWQNDAFTTLFRALNGEVRNIELPIRTQDLFGLKRLVRSNCGSVRSLRSHWRAVARAH